MLDKLPACPDLLIKEILKGLVFISDSSPKQPAVGTRQTKAEADSCVLPEHGPGEEGRCPRLLITGSQVTAYVVLCTSMEMFIHMRGDMVGLILMYRCTAQTREHATLPHVRKSFPLPGQGNAKTHVVVKCHWVRENPQAENRHLNSWGDEVLQSSRS